MNKQELYEKTKALCSALIQSPSSSGHEQGVVAVVEKAMRELGYDEVTIDDYGNVIGCIKGNRNGAKVLMDGHIDTVPVDDAEQWEHDPYSGLRQEDRIFGRGASDMKGAVAAMICSAAYYAKECKRNFPGEIYVAGVVYEELYEGVAARKISDFVKPDFVVIGEASELNLKIGQRGRAEIVLETTGKAAHSANPEKGVNAVLKMTNLLMALEAAYQPHAHPVLGKGIQVVTDIISQPYPGASVVPERCRATLDRRLLVGDTKETVLAPIQKIIDELATRDPNFHATVRLSAESKPCYTGNVIDAERFFPAWLFNEDDAFVQNSYRALCEAGLRPKLTTYSFCTNGSHYAGEKGIRTIGFGPSRENLAHTRNEYILCEQLEKAADGYVAVLGALLEETGR